MSRLQPLEFQQDHIAALVDRMMALKAQYDRLAGQVDAAADVRRNAACVLLQAPTGIGKTLMACDVLSQFSAQERVLWLWFAPFAGLVAQAQATIARQAPNLVRLSPEADRRLQTLVPGAIFVLTWQTVAARSRDSRIARTSGDAGVSMDDLMQLARQEGLRIGVVVDEAHHGFVRATQATQFFSQVIAPDYVLLMTATPRDQDVGRFSQLTGYRLGGPEEWATVSRSEGVDAELLKRSVKAARFIARNQDEAQLVAYEEVALRECAAMHRTIKQTLAHAGVDLVPLMLVQVPNGGEELRKARDYLVRQLGFAEEAVKAHTADEPDPNLAALADDPQVEVILFKMAIATGFDAPRAFTLAALRGARDEAFGVQVVGRIMRVHRLLQGRLKQLPPMLSFGYVFLANSEAQEGLVGAANLINQIPGHITSASPSTVITIVADEPQVQVVRPWESLSLFGRSQLPVGSTSPAAAAAAPAEQERPATEIPAPEQPPLFADLLAQGRTPEQALFSTQPGQRSVLVDALVLETQTSAKRYRRRAEVPSEFVTEALPERPEDFEERLVAHIDFRPVLGDRTARRSRLIQRTTDLFDGQDPDDQEVWGTLSPVAIAERARQLAFAFDDVDRREFLAALKARFRQTLLDQGHEPPDSPEELTRQLELVLVRNPGLIRAAYKRVRAAQVATRPVRLRDVLESDEPLPPSRRNAYGVFPPMGVEERAFAQLLDTAPEVTWWHRNPVRNPDSVALYSWAEGPGFFPDFLVGVEGRPAGEGPALTELKGPHLLEYDKAKAGAAHPIYGRVFMVGKTEAARDYRLWRLTTAGALVDDGPFEPHRLRYN